jgi:HEAT repeat protein
MRNAPRPLVAALALVASLALPLALLPACQSTGSEPRRGEPEPYVPLPDEAPQTIGFFLTRFDISLLQWSELKLASASARDQNTLAALEANMQKRARERRGELLAELETGAPVNRRIAAAALGFSHDPTVLGPLLAALEERDPELVQKALLAIGVLGLPETPVTVIEDRLRNDTDPWTRNNAAFALLSLARAGSKAPQLAGACRAGLADSEPGVRAQCASALGVLADRESVAVLGDMLMDRENLVALACAASLARIGRQHPDLKGTAGRSLAGALGKVQPDRRAHLLGALRWLSDMYLGEDEGPWLEWAHKLP